MTACDGRPVAAISLRDDAEEETPLRAARAGCGHWARDGGVGRPMFPRAWIHAQGVPSYAPHYISPLSGGGALTGTGVHPLDLAVWLLGCPPLRSVAGLARSRLADLANLPPELEAMQLEDAR